MEMIVYTYICLIFDIHLLLHHMPYGVLYYLKIMYKEVIFMIVWLRVKLCANLIQTLTHYFAS